MLTFFENLLDTAKQEQLARSEYEDGSGVVKQCCHCRRIERPGEAGCWDWIRDWVEGPPENTSHSLCQICFHTYYPDLARAR